MNITINFASQPYRQVQRFLFRWRIIVSAVALLSVMLLYASLTTYLSWRVTRKQVVELEAQIERQDRMKAAAEAFLNRPESRQTRLRAELLNSTIARKAFSWTELFADLEPIMPPRLHVTSIRPEINVDGQLVLHLSVSASAKQAGVDLVRRLEQSSHFTQAQIIDEKKQSDRSSGEVAQYSIAAVYIPAFARGKSALAMEEAVQTTSPSPAEVASNRSRMQTEQPNVGH